MIFLKLSNNINLAIIQNYSFLYTLIMDISFFRKYRVILNFSCILFIIILFSSCITQRKIEYLQQNNGKATEYKNNTFRDYTLKPNDELYIQISSLDDAAANIFSSSANQIIGGLTPYGASLLSHTVDREGFLELPVVGKIEVKDKTIDQVTEMLQKALINVLNQPIITIKLVNRYVSVLGEVRLPGHYNYSEDKLSIFDAISMAGDITEFGNKKTVILLRNQNSTNTRYEINLTESKVLASEFYYLQPNDIVYVKPLRGKFWNFRPFPFEIIFSSITSTILILTYIK